ncbi:MAG: bifunctional folylpolyglutamate synthase/dihydrofolate synthase [Lachnospiraceae bacterium]|nr:bifunctional folylpolyglutamate synthase/dihydrofolate synthase [Lachnospiraceae bacterium]
MDYREALKFVNSLPKFSPAACEPGVEPFNLDSIRYLLEKLGNPQKKLKYVHIAGTNGKGSVAAYLSSILMESGLKTGIYTSPFLERFTERIRIGNNEIEEEAFAKLAEEVKEKSDEMVRNGLKAPSEFEIITAIAFLYFVANDCDIVVLETGLGGRLDATNVIDCPEIAIITTISFDHMQVLGDTLEKIAYEKAGIIKRGCDVLIFPQKDEADKVFREAARKQAARLYRMSGHPALKSRSLEGQSFSMKPALLDDIPGISPQYILDLEELRTVLLGSYQISNAALAVNAACILHGKGYPVTSEAIQRGILKARWNGRFELLQRNPYILIDGSHNAEGAEVLREGLELYFSGEKIVFIVGILRDKEYRKMLKAIIPLASCFFAIEPPIDRALSAEELASQIIDCIDEAESDTGGTAAETVVGVNYGTDMNSLKDSVFPMKDLESALEAARNKAGKNGVICAFGSLYYIGALRSLVLGGK